MHIDGDDEPLDLFQHYHLLPQNVQDLLSKLGELDQTYEACNQLIEELEELGYTCDYTLSAEPYNLRLNQKPNFKL